MHVSAFSRPHALYALILRVSVMLISSSRFRYRKVFLDAVLCLSCFQQVFSAVVHSRTAFYVGRFPLVIGIATGIPLATLSSFAPSESFRGCRGLVCLVPSRAGLSSWCYAHMGYLVDRTFPHASLYGSSASRCYALLLRILTAFRQFFCRFLEASLSLVTGSCAALGGRIDPIVCRSRLDEVNSRHLLPSSAHSGLSCGCSQTFAHH